LYLTHARFEVFMVMIQDAVFWVLRSCSYVLW